MTSNQGRIRASSRVWNNLASQSLPILIAIAIVAVSCTQLFPRISHPPQPTTLLNDSVILNEDNYQKQYNLTLDKGDQLNIQITGNGDLVSIEITPQNSPTQPVLDQEDQTLFIFQWTVPQSGPYVFTLSAETGAHANIIITKT
jgi:hypothetical protein